MCKDMSIQGGGYLLFYQSHTIYYVMQIDELCEMSNWNV